MPIYEFACTKCGHQFEKRLSMTNTRRVTCPKCRSRKVDKLISPFFYFGRRSEGGRRPSPSVCSTCTSRSCSTCR